MLNEHEDIREIIREARLQLSGSPLWWRLTKDTVSTWGWQLLRGEHDPLDCLRGAGSAARGQLARQWQAFIAAQLRDRETAAQPDPQV